MSNSKMLILMLMLMRMRMLMCAGMSNMLVRKIIDAINEASETIPG